MTERTKFKATLTPAGNGSSIEMNGETLENVRSFRVETTANKGTRVFVEFCVSHVDITGEGYVTHSKQVADDTARLDWLEKQNRVGIDSQGYGEYRLYAGDGFKKLRAVVDAERATELECSAGCSDNATSK